MGCAKAPLETAARSLGATRGFVNYVSDVNRRVRGIFCLLFSALWQLHLYSQEWHVNFVFLSLCYCIALLSALCLIAIKPEFEYSNIQITDWLKWSHS